MPILSQASRVFTSILRKTTLLLSLFFCHFFLFGQVNFTPSCYDEVTYPLNNDTLYFPSASDTFLICPAVPGDTASITFTYFDIEVNGDQNAPFCWDFVEIFDDGSSMGQYCSEASGNGDAPFNANADLSIHHTFTSAAPDNCLTVVFRSDLSEERTGFAFKVNCPISQPCQNALDYESVFGPIPSHVSGTPRYGNCNHDPDTLSKMLLQTDPHMFDAICNSSADGYAWYKWMATGERLYWNPIDQLPAFEVVQGSCSDYVSLGCLKYKHWGYIDNLKPGEEYYIIMSDDTFNRHRDLVWCFETAFYPLNDSCVNFIMLPCDTTIIYDITNASDRDRPDKCVVEDDSQAGVWFSFIGTGDSMIVSTMNNATDFDTKLQLFTGTCNSLQCLDGNDDFSDSLQSQIEFLSTFGEQYYLYSDGFDFDYGIVELTIECLETCFNSYVVTSTSDSGLGSLRQTIDCASSGDTITFSADIDGDTIYMSTGHITNFSKDLVILGNGPENTIIDASGQSNRVFVFGDSDIKMRGLTIQNGGSSAMQDIAGAFYSYGDGEKLDVINCHFKNNRSANQAGAIFIFKGVLANFINCKFDGNEAGERGGAVFTQAEEFMRFHQCVFSNNSASGNGGAILSIGHDMEIINCTFYKNNATAAGGVIYNQNGNTTYLYNNIFNENLIPDVNDFFAVVEAFYCITDNPGEITVGVNGNMNVDPLFIDPLNGNYALQQNSPAIDAANSIYLPRDVGDADMDGDIFEDIDVDIEGNPRLNGCAVDFGPYENQILNTNIVQNTNDNGPGSLRAAVNCASTGDTIRFSTVIDGQTISMQSGDLTVLVDLVIIGNGIENTIVSGVNNGDNRLFEIYEGQLQLHQLTCQNSTISYNVGGVAYIRSAASLIAQNCQFNDNQAQSYGGVLGSLGGNITVINSIFKRNTLGASLLWSSLGSCIYAQGNARVEVVQCLFDENGRSEAVRNHGNGGLHVVQSTFVNNDFAGIYASGVTDIHHCVFNNNGYGAVWKGNSLITLNASNNLADVRIDLPQSGTIDGEAIFISDSTGDYRLAENSPGIDRGNYSQMSIDHYDVDADLNTIERIDVDLNGSNRVQGCGLDLGAFESPFMSDEHWVTNPLDGDPGSLRNVITCASDGDTIQFTMALDGDLLNMTLGEIELNKSLFFLGNGSDNTIIDGTGQQDRFFELLDATTVTFKGMTIQFGGNTTYAQRGGAIASTGMASQLNLIDCVLSNNRSLDRGGAIYSTSGSGNFINCEFRENQSLGGGSDGGACAIQSIGGVFSFYQCVFENNFANGNGAALYGALSDFFITNSTMVKNESGIDHSTVYVHANAELNTHNNIYFNNNNTPAILTNQATLNSSDNLVDIPGDLIIGSNGNFIGDPYFVDFASGDYQLSDSSDAIDLGAIQFLPLDSFDLDNDGNTTEVIERDLANNARIAICGLDLGAFENQQAPECPGENDECAGAIDLGVLSDSCTNFIVNTYAATWNPNDLIASCVSFSAYYNLWYKIVGPASGVVQFTSSTSTSSEKIRVAFWKRCDSQSNEQIACFTSKNFTVTNLQPDSTYYISMGTEEGNRPRGVFDYCARAICPAPTFSQSNFITEISDNSALFSWNNSPALIDESIIRICPENASVNSSECLEYIVADSLETLLVNDLEACTKYSAYISHGCQYPDVSDWKSLEFSTEMTFSNSIPICGDTVNYPPCTEFYDATALDTFIVCPRDLDTATIRFIEFHVAPGPGPNPDDEVRIIENGALIAVGVADDFQDQTFTASDTGNCLVIVMRSRSGYVSTGFSFIVENCKTCPQVQSVGPAVFQNYYFADSIIISDATILANQYIQYQAGDGVVLDSGFQVQLGAEFFGKIGPCP